MQSFVKLESGLIRSSESVWHIDGLETIEWRLLDEGVFSNCVDLLRTSLLAVGRNCKLSGLTEPISQW